MNFKSLFIAGVLAILTMSTAFAKTYDLTFTSPAKAGSLQLNAGQYRMSVDGNKVTFTEVKTNKSTTTEATVENSEQKFNETRVDTTTESGAAVVKAIRLGGSKIKLNF